MPDVLLVADNVTVTGGPAKVSVDVDFGPQGRRGSLIFSGSGTPTLNASSSPSPQVYDWYINSDTTDADYLYMYQYIYNESSSLVWTKVFKLVPNTFNGNFLFDFQNGVAEIEVPISETNFPLVFPIITEIDNNDAASVDSEAEMLALSNPTVDSYVFRTDIAKYFRLIDEENSNQLSSWTPQASFNVQISFQGNNPISSSFVVGAPKINNAQDYVFPITVYATKATLGSSISWSKPSESVIGHISLVVI